MFSIQKVRRHVQSLAEGYIPTRLQSRFFVEVEGLGLTGFSSLNANGRLLATNRHTSESRIRRAISDQRFTRLILKIIIRQYLPQVSCLTKGSLRFSLDHSQFGDFYAAVLSVSIGKGRALPVWCVVTRFKRGQMLKPLMRGLCLVISELSYEQRSMVTMTMDRWFGIPTLLTWLDDEHIHFIVRMKAGTPVGVPWQAPGVTVPIGEISLEDTPVTYTGRDWRLIRSEWDENMKEDEPWFLLTNIVEDKQRGSRRHILNLYAERFEIEEYFKDSKWIQRYKWHLIQKKENLTITLLFAFMGWWVLYAAGKTLIRQNRSREIDPKKRLSWFREVWEHWQRLRTISLFVRP